MKEEIRKTLKPMIEEYLNKYPMTNITFQIRKYEGNLLSQNYIVYINNKDYLIQLLGQK